MDLVLLAGGGYVLGKICCNLPTHTRQVQMKVYGGGISMGTRSWAMGHAVFEEVEIIQLIRGCMKVADNYDKIFHCQVVLIKSCNIFGQIISFLRQRKLRD